MIKLPEINETQKEALIAHCKECLEIVDRADANIRKSSKYQSPYLQNLLVEHQTQRLNYLITLSYLESPKIIPDGLHQSTAELVIGFATALAEKLHLSEQKYGWSDGWKNTDWQEKCLEDFNHHINKGDPRDVAAYCAFMWFHGWQTQSLNAVAQPDDGNEGYVKAFYEIASILGIAAQPNSPKHVFETVMKPKLQALAATAQPVSDEWASLLTDRQRSVINFALNRFMSDAYSKANIVAQDKRLDSSMADTFIADAKDAEALMGDIGRHRDKMAAAPGGQDD